MKKNIEISIVIPCYNSEKTIASVVNDAYRTLILRNVSFEMVLVNDGSKDGTWDVIKKLSKKYPFVKGINLTTNFGQHAALMAGYRNCSGSISVALDDDGQTDPKDLWLLIDKINEGFDVVMARYPEIKEGLFRRFGSHLNMKMSEILINKPKNIRGSSYMAMKKCVIKSVVSYDKPFPYIGGLVYRSTKNIGEVSINHLDRKYGKSGYTIVKLVSLIMNGFTSFSVKPLRISSVVGALTAVIGFVYGLAIVIKKIINPLIQVGYSSIMATLLFVGGMIMLMLGMIGEYVGRIYIGINGLPQYVIKEETKANHK